MLLNDLYKINDIDGTIQKLLGDLQTLYDQRTSLMNPKNERRAARKPSKGMLDFHVNLRDIDLSLDQPKRRLSL